MTLTIDVPTELEQRLEAEAKRQGVSRLIRLGLVDYDSELYLSPYDE